MEINTCNPDQLQALESLEAVDYVVIADNDKVYQFLVREGLVSCGYRHDIQGRPYCASITEKGKAYLATYRTDTERFNRQFKWNRGLSIAAIIISIIALFQRPLLKLLNILLQHLTQ